EWLSTVKASKTKNNSCSMQHSRVVFLFEKNRVLKTMSISILPSDPSSAPDDVTSKSRFYPKISPSGAENRVKT
ncbi:hypothetical protein PENTCL1PPCAC_9703, partial [Pristionchus entomophagus]